MKYNVPSSMDYTLKNKVTTEDSSTIDIITWNSCDKQLRVETNETNEEIWLVTSFRNKSEKYIEIHNIFMKKICKVNVSQVKLSLDLPMIKVNCVSK